MISKRPVKSPRYAEAREAGTPGAGAGRRRGAFLDRCVVVDRETAAFTSAEPTRRSRAEVLDEAMTPSLGRAGVTNVDSTG